MAANVSPEGRNLFIAIHKIFKEVRWRNSDIVIYDQVSFTTKSVITFKLILYFQVIITPPYKVDDIKGNVNSKEYGYVRRVVSIADSLVSSFV